MNRSAWKSRGFTLIELVLVILIIGMLLAVVAPSLGGMVRSQRLDRAARTITSMLKEARIRSSTHAKPYRLVLDTQDNTAWLESFTPEGFARSATSYDKIIELHDQLSLTLEGAQKEGQRFYIRVEPDGTADLAQITITRLDDGEQIAVYCRTPTEPYIIGEPITRQQLENGADDVRLED